MFNRPFLPFCRGCGRPLRSAVAFRECGVAGNVSPWRVSVEEAWRRWFGPRVDLDSRMLVAEGLLFLQLASGWILGLHPALREADANAPRVVLAQRPADSADEVFPMQLVGTTLVVATRRKIWQLPLASLWDVNNRLAGDAEGSLGPHFQAVFQAPPHWELACAPAVYHAGDGQMPELLVLLRQPGQLPIQRFAWVRLDHPVNDGADAELRLDGIAGEHVSCTVLSSTLAVVSTEQGQWLLARSAAGRMRVQFMLARRLATMDEAGERRPATVVLRYALAGEEHVFSFFLGEDRRMYYYVTREQVPDGACESRAPHPLAVPAGRELVPVAVLQGMDQPAVLCVKNNTLYRCELSGSTHSLDEIPDVGHQGFWRIHVEGEFLHLLWKGAGGQRETCGFSLLRYSSQLDPLFQQPLTDLRAMPVAWGRHLFVLQEVGHPSPARDASFS